MAKGFQPGNKLGSNSQSAKEFLQDIRKQFIKNRELVLNALQEAINDDPLKAYNMYFVPAMPKTLELTGDEEKPLQGIIQITKTYASSINTNNQTN